MRYFFSGVKTIIIITFFSIHNTYATNGYPTSVKCKPDYVRADEESSDCPPEFRRLVVDGKLSLYKLTPEFLNSLSPNLCRKLFKFLGKHRIWLKWKDIDGKVGSGKVPSSTIKRFVPLINRDASNAATALFLITATQSEDTVLLSKLLASGAGEICSGLKGNARIVLSPNIFSRAMLILASSIPTSYAEVRRQDVNANELIQDSSKLVYSYLKYWAEKDLKKINTSLAKILQQARSFPLNPGQLGALLGAMIAGADDLFFEISDNTAKRLLTANLIANLTVISTNFIGLFGLHPAIYVGIIGIAIPVAIDIPIAAAPNIAALRTPSELFYKHFVKEVEGKLEMHILQQMTPDNETQVFSTLDWMKAAIHINGHRS